MRDPLPATVVERLADWIVSVKLEDIPERVRERARCQTLSVLGAIHASVNAGAGASVMKAVSKWDKPGRCTIFPSGEKTALHEAILVNNALSMGLDFDDYLYMGHTGHSAVLAAWAVGEQLGASTADVLTAQIIANEIEGRVGASVVFGPQNGQAWSFIHAIGGAAVAAKLYRLDRSQTAHALAIALYQPPFTLWPGFFGPTGKELTSAFPTVNGVMAAQFAAEGMTGARDIFENPRKGFWAHFAFQSLPVMMTGLGRAWLTDTLTYKLYPGCAYIDTTMDALFALLADYRRQQGRDLAPDQVDRISVEASALTVAMDNLTSAHGDPANLTPVQINFSIPANIAIAILAGRHTSAEMRPAFLETKREVIAGLAERVEMRHDWEMTIAVIKAFAHILGPGVIGAALRKRDLLRVIPGMLGHIGGPKRTELGLAHLARDHWSELPGLLAGLRGGDAARTLDGVDFSRFEMTFPARVTLVTRGGVVLETRRDVPRGAPGSPGYPGVVRDKYRQEAGVRHSAEQVEAAIAGIERFEASTLDALVINLCAV